MLHPILSPVPLPVHHCTELFLKWGPENGIVGAEKLKFAPVGASGDRGLAARVRLPANETIVQIPPNMIISILSLQGTSPSIELPLPHWI